MRDDEQKQKIDLDDLVNTLLTEKSVASMAKKSPASAAEEPFPEDLVSPESFVLSESPAPSDDLTLPESTPLPYAGDYPLIMGEEPDDGLSPKKREKKRLFARRSRRVVEEEEDRDYEDVWADWGLTPIGHYSAPDLTKTETHVDSVPIVEETPAVSVEKPAEEPVEKPAEKPVEEPAEEPAEEAPKPLMVDEFPAVQAVTETVTLPIPPLPKEEDEATRVIDLNEKPVASAVSVGAMPAQPTEPVSEQLPDQLSLEELVRVEDIEEPDTEDEEDTVSDEETEDEPDAEEQLRRTRQEKIRDFVLDGDEENNEPEEEPDEAEEEPLVEDFTTYEDKKAVQVELQYHCRTGLVSMLLTGVLEGVLLAVTLMTYLIGQSPITEVGYLAVHVFALSLMLVLNYAAVTRGLSGLFTLCANGYTAPAVTASLALGGVILHFFDLSVALPYWTPLAGLPLLGCAIAQYIRATRIRENFAFVSYPNDKYTASIVEDEKMAREVGHQVAVDGKARVAYFHRTAFLSEYLANADEEDAGDRLAVWMAPLLLLLTFAVPLGLLAAGVVRGFWDWLQVLLGTSCLLTVSFAPAMQFPLWQCSRRILQKGGFLVGWKAVRDFGHPDALLMDVADIYPDESMLLHGIKTFSGMHIDNAILDAASLVIRSGGPLSLIFRRIIQDKSELLREVDSLVYEQGMGLSGWVDGRRVLVGNRRLLENHGVDVPSSDYEARYAKDGRRLVYLSTAGELSAMFVVSYLPDPTIADALRELCRAKVTLLVRTCDPNITATDLCRDFELDDYYVDILPASAGRTYDQLAHEESASAPAVLASNGHILGTAMVLSACRTLKIKSRIALLTQGLAALIGLLLGVIWGVGGMDLHFLQALLFTVVTALATWLLPLLRKV